MIIHFFLTSVPDEAIKLLHVDGF